MDAVGIGIDLVIKTIIVLQCDINDNLGVGFPILGRRGTREGDWVLMDNLLCLV